MRRLRQPPLLFKAFLTPRIVEAARQQAAKGLQGRMEGHAEMDMSIHEGTIWQRMTSDKGRTAISHFFVLGSPQSREAALSLFGSANITGLGSRRANLRRIGDC